MRTSRPLGAQVQRKYYSQQPALLDYFEDQHSAPLTLLPGNLTLKLPYALKRAARGK